ncbi:MAG: hypothetical protein LUE17_07815 [Planctomycetaceae bacterium]|nr:hypothetical protein [Planctomycetaceae bacterium]
MRTLFLTVAAVCFATFAMAADATIPNRFDQVKPGEWIVMQDVSGGDRAGERNRISVVSVADGVITIRREHYAADGSLIETKEHALDIARITERQAALQTRATSITPGFITVKDKEIPVVAVAFKGENGEDADREYMIWVSADLPLGGLAKTWCSDAEFPQAEVVDYGF